MHQTAASLSAALTQLFFQISLKLRLEWLYQTAEQQNRRSGKLGNERSSGKEAAFGRIRVQACFSLAAASASSRCCPLSLNLVKTCQPVIQGAGNDKAIIRFFGLHYILGRRGLFLSLSLSKFHPSFFLTLHSPLSPSLSPFFDLKMHSSILLAATALLPAVLASPAPWNPISPRSSLEARMDSDAQMAARATILDPSLFCSAAFDYIVVGGG